MKKSTSYTQKFIIYIILITIIPISLMTLYTSYSYKKAIYEERELGLEQNMDIVFSILDRNYQLYLEGLFDNESIAKSITAHDISEFRYGELKKDYFWIQETINHEPYMVMHPFLPELDNTNLVNYTDPNGTYLFVEMIAAVEENDESIGEGFVTYEWQYYDDMDRVEPKLSFVRKFTPWDWIIGTGVYIDDVDEIIQNKVITQILFIISFYSVLGSILAAMFVREMKNSKTMENSLKQSESLYVNVIETMGEGLIMVDQDFYYTFINQRMTEMLGYSKEEMLGHHASEFIIPESQHILKEQKKLVEKEENTSYQLVFETKSGNRLITQVSPKRIYDEHHNYQGSLVVITDITQTKVMEETLLKSQKIESLGILAGGIAHDFNNILGSILGNLSLAKYEIGGDENEMRNLLNDCENASFRAKNLTKQLLTFSKGGLPIKTVVSVEKIARDTATFSLRGSSSTFKIEVENNVFPVLADQDQLAQVIQNMIINAEQAMPRGGIITIKILNTEHEGMDYVELIIQDSGSGIPEDDLPKIFDPYFSTKPDGSGLGLAVCYSIIKKHSGFIEVESILHQGTTFHIFIPAAQAEIISQPKIVEDMIDGDGKLVIVLEDNPGMQDIFKKMGKKLGFYVLVYSDGSHFLHTFNRAFKSGIPISMVILDLTIPGGMGGKETIQKLREMDPNVYAIVSSGYSDDQVMMNYSEYGFNNILKKPFTIEDFNRIIAEKAENNKK